MLLPERDWRHLSAVRPRALDRFCRNVLDECAAAIADASRSHHERYLHVFELIRERDRTLSAAFDRWSRSNAPMSLLYFNRLGLMTRDEVAGFSDETREWLRGVAGDTR